MSPRTDEKSSWQVFQKTKGRRKEEMVSSRGRNLETRRAERTIVTGGLESGVKGVEVGLLVVPENAELLEDHAGQDLAHAGGDEVVGGELLESGGVVRILEGCSERQKGQRNGSPGKGAM